MKEERPGVKKVEIEIIKEERPKVQEIEVKIYSIPMTDEEKKKWAKPEDICPVCGLQFGGRKQAKIGKIFKSNGLPAGTIIHKKCAQR